MIFQKLAGLVLKKQFILIIANVQNLTIVIFLLMFLLSLFRKVTVCQPTVSPLNSLYLCCRPHVNSVHSIKMGDAH